MTWGWAGEAGANALLAGFLDRFAGRTRQAYRADIEDLARFLGVSPPAAVNRLLGGGRAAAWHVVMSFAIDLRDRRLAPTTVGRRLATLRSLAGMANDQGLIRWVLETPTDAEVSAAIRERADQASYLLPRHRSEIDRLDVQHYALRLAMGSEFLAPVASPGRVLDAGSGTGQWGFDVCQRSPGTQVVGVDLVPGKPGAPAGYHTVRANLMQRLPFGDARFDFVHQRLLVVGLPLAVWPQVVEELVRVTRPGGWVELVEPRTMADRIGPATRRLIEMALAMMAPLALDTSSQVFESLDGYLRQAGLEGVARRELVLPIGSWGEQVGELMAIDLRAAFTRLNELLEARGGVSAAESKQLIEEAQAEFEEERSVFNFAVAFGRKPGAVGVAGSEYPGAC